MAVRYCYLCDAPASSDPCPTCGRPLHRPEASRPLPEERAPAVIAPAEPTGRRVLPGWVKWAVAVAALVVIAALLRSPFGI